MAIVQTRGIIKRLSRRRRVVLIASRARLITSTLETLPVIHAEERADP
jgi:hypothetical protein